MTDTISAHRADEGIDGAGADSSSALASLLDRRRAEWLAWRKTGLTATDAPAILGLSPWASPFSVWATKTGLYDRDAIEVTDAMEFGSRAERMIGQWFEDLNPDLYVAGEQTWCTSQTEPHMLATVDGFVFDSPFCEPSIDTALGGFEIKTTTDTADAWDEQIPDHVVAQVQWQMAVTGLPCTWLATLHLGFRVAFRVRFIERDEVDIATITEAGRVMWFDHVLANLPPEVDGSTATSEALKAAYPGDPALEPVVAPELRFSIERIKANKDRIKLCETTIEFERNKLRAAMGDATHLIAGHDANGKPITLATWKPSKPRAGFDHHAALARYPRALARFVTSTPVRPLLPKTPKD